MAIRLFLLANYTNIGIPTFFQDTQDRYWMSGTGQLFQAKKNLAWP